MSLPTTLSTTTVTGTYVDLLGNPIRGSISWSPQTILKEKTENKIIIPTTIVKTFDATGTFSITLPVSNDPDVTPQPFVYIATENFSGGRVIEISLPVESAGTTINLADLLPAVSPTEALGYITYAEYENLLTRYNAANNTRTIVVSASDYEGNAQLYAELASRAAGAVSNFTSNQLMMMGV